MKLNVGMGADKIGSPLCPAAGIAITCVYSSAPYTKELILIYLPHFLISDKLPPHPHSIRP
jgi:hypothetical protein